MNSIAVFPEDTDISLSPLQIYWKGTGGLHAYEVEELCLHLSDLSLLLPRDTEQPTIRLHDVMRSYLIQRVGKQLSTLHQRLLDAHQQHYHLTRWADVPQSEAYLWQRLIFHLCQAGNQEVLQTTLTDLGYLTHKALYVGVLALEADLLLASTSASEAAPSFFTALHRTIGRISHLLHQVHTPAEMGGLLLSHLGWEAAFAGQRFPLERELLRPFLTAWRRLPDQASSALIRTLHGHTDKLTQILVS